MMGGGGGRVGLSQQGPAVKAVGGLASQGGTLFMLTSGPAFFISRASKVFQGVSPPWTRPPKSDSIPTRREDDLAERLGSLPRLPSAQRDPRAVPRRRPNGEAEGGEEVWNLIPRGPAFAEE